MPGKEAAALLIFPLALLFPQAKEPPAAAGISLQDSSNRSTDTQIPRIQAILTKFDPKFKGVSNTAFEIVNGDLRINARADQPSFYDGKPYRNSTTQNSLYGSTTPSEKFYGVELVVHYLLQVGSRPLGGVTVLERITVLYENSGRFNPMRPRVLDSKPFLIGKDGTFQDRQVLGRYEESFPKGMEQILKQELVLDNELIATIYIVRTTKDIRLVGYSVPPLLPDSVLP